MAEKQIFSEKIKTAFTSLRSQITQNVNKERFQKAIQNFDIQQTLEWSAQLFQKQSANFYGTLITVTLSTYFISDLTALTLGEYIPEPPLSRPNRLYNSSEKQKNINEYSIIFSRNLFSSQGLIPGDDAPANGGQPGDPGGVAVKSLLPLNLIGTLIMENKFLSIATIEEKSSSSVFPVQVNDEIPDKIKVLEIEPRRVTFVNKAMNRREFIELPEDSQMNPRIVTGGKPAGGGIEKVSSTQFNVARQEVDRALADINSILTQARAVPNFENGSPNGYKLFQIVPGSIYDKLGLHNGDVITGINGQTINDPGKAFELFSELKTSNHLELQLKKEGKISTYTYDIH